MLALLLAVSFQTAVIPPQGAGTPAPGAGSPSSSVIGPDDVVARIPTTGFAVKLALPAYANDPVLLTSLKRRMNDRALLQGRTRGEEGTVKMVAAFGETHTSREWREKLMGGQLVGAGQFDVGPVSCTEQVHDLEPPFADLGWHGFLTAADTSFDFTLFTLRKGEESPIKRPDFERIVKGARYAVLRLGGWEAMPAVVLDRMHEGLAHVGEESGAAWLANQAATANDGWAYALAAAEIGMHEKLDASTRLALYDRAIAALEKLPGAGKPERFALVTALSGRAVALRDASKIDEALVALGVAREKAEEHGAIAKAAIAYDTATVHALRKDAGATVAALKEAIAGNVEWRAYAKREPGFQLVGKDKALFEVLADPK